MADPVVVDPRKEPDPTPTAMDFATELESLAIPPLDEQFFASEDAIPPEDFFSDLGLGLGFEETCDYELTFDDIGDLYLPSETEDFLVPGPFDDCSAGLSPEAVKSASPESGSSTVSVVKDCDVAGFLDCRSPVSGGCNSEFSPNSTEKKSNSGGVSSDREEDLRVEPASSQGSGNFNSGVSEGENSPVHSRSSDRDVSSTSFVEKKVKSEGIGKNSVPKRKKETEEEGNSEARTPKYRRSSVPSEPAPDSVMSPLSDDDDKRKARLMRNRESAQLSRQRKKHYVEELEDKVRNMNSTIADLNGRISYIMAENATLRQQMSGGHMPPQPPGMYPHPAMGPMAYPWVPCTPYIMKPQGSQVPLVPIPRLKPQHTASASRVKKSESKKSEGGKTKKVASISFLGLLFFVLLFGGLVPIVNVNFGGFTDKGLVGSGYINGKPYSQHLGRVLTVDDGSNRSGENVGLGVGGNKRVYRERGHERKKGFECGKKDLNGSESLAASLYVPRNDKLVKIDGNLIIHSVLASEQTKASLARSEMTRNSETRLAIARNMAASFAVQESGVRHGHLYRNPTERVKALSSGAAHTAKDHPKSSAADGKLQQWFREGLEGPMLSSGMCTEVFQFDVSPASTSGAIVPASTVANSSSNTAQNNSTNYKGANRRILRRLPALLSDATYNITDKHSAQSPNNESFSGNGSTSPMIVSVLVDPREAGSEGEIEGVMKPKSLSRIFVVVLMDSVKYVTYSCVLPRTGPHLVTA